MDDQVEAAFAVAEEVANWLHGQDRDTVVIMKGVPPSEMPRPVTEWAEN